MVKAPEIANEKNRIEKLRSLEILDSGAEVAFDNLTRLAAQICETPIALVSLVDSNRQWFKSRFGTDTIETPRDISFCGHAIASEDLIFEVPDANLDDRFSDNPLVTEEPKIRYYAGAPLRTSCGLSLGTLCVIDKIPRKLTRFQMDSLLILSDQIKILIENYESTKKLAKEKICKDFLNEKLEFCLNALPSMYAIFDGPELINSFGNDQFWAFFTNSIPKEKVSLREIIHESLFKKIQNKFHELTPDNPFGSIEKIKYLRDFPSKTQEYFLSCHLKLFKNNTNDVVSYIIILEDVTSAVLAESEIQNKSQQAHRMTELLNQAINLSKLALYDWDIKNNSLITNEQFQIIWEISDSFAPDHIIQKIHPDDRDRISQLIYQAITHKTFYKSEYKILLSGGKIKWIQAQGKVDYDKDGQATNFFGTCIDITDQKMTELKIFSENYQFDQIIEKSPAAMAIWEGENLVFSKVNADYQALFPNRELLGRPLLEACPELVGQGFDDLLKEVLRTGQPFVGKEVLAKIAPKVGERPIDKYFNFSYIPLFDTNGKPYAIYDHAVDVTEIVIYKKELENARIEAEKANATKSQFLANMSHEIRSPLGAIMGFSELLKPLVKECPEGQKYTEIISRNSEHLLRIVDDILDLSKVEAGKMNIEQVVFSLPEFIAETTSILNFKAKEKGIITEVEIGNNFPELISTDPTRLKQIISNMTSNALKFTERGIIKVFFNFKSPWLEISVADTGIGISEEQIKFLFSAFQQADTSTTRKFGGTGLGLILTKKLCELLNGDFYLEKSSVGIGSTFKAKIAINVVSKDIEKVNSPLKHSIVNNQLQQRVKQLDNLSILLIEDSEDNQLLIEFILSNEGASVTIANNGEEGIKLALKNRFDIIICDMQMPIKDGQTTVKELRSLGYQVPIVALTAHAMKEEHDLAIKAGFNEYLTKPINRNQLFKTILKFTT